MANWSVHEKLLVLLTFRSILRKSYFANNMSGREYLGEFEQVVLLALLHLGEKGYGLAIRREILQRTGRSVSLGALYSTLNRLESKSFVDSWLADPTPQRGGKSKRYFQIRPAGLVALERTQRMLALMREGLSWNAVGEQ
jgi:PadR family transcriptional regulator, regulatory protein PadR